MVPACGEVMLMTGEEIAKRLMGRGSSDLLFIKWWRTEHDYLDFDLVETFLENIRPQEIIDGFDLLTTEQMWQKLLRVADGRVRKAVRDGDEIIIWEKGPGNEIVCPFRPESIIEIFDVETNGNYLDA
jgi:hypothetical protein